MIITDAISKSVDYIQGLAGDYQPKVAMILGSGLGLIADELENPVTTNYDEVPGFPQTTVQGHAGRLLIGELQGKTVLIMQGRFHYYEGHSMQTITFPIRVLNAFGIETLLITSASGGVNKAFQAGDVMLLTDHINFVFSNPLIGKNNEELGPRFPDTSELYDLNLITKTREVAKNIGFHLQEGVYAFVTGPSYETPAEVEMMRSIGADTVGMSTVPEALVAHHGGMKVMGITYVSNMATGISEETLHHEEVIETMEKIKDGMIAFIHKLVAEVL